MKKTHLILILGAFLLVGTKAVSQASLAIGLKAGPNFANINVNESADENYKNRTGFHGGAFVLIKLTKIGIQPEVLFSQQGSKVNYTLGSTEINYSYVNVPIIFKLYTVAGINLQLGPQFGFLTKAVEEDVVGNIKTTTDVKDKLKGSETSIALGAGWDLPFGLTIDARYNLGLSKINDQNGSATARNQVWQLSLGYKLIKLGK
jgi:hypothetical protein